MIRLANENDQAAIAALTVERGYPQSALSASDRLQRLIDASEHCLLVAEDSRGEVVGWIHVFIALRVESPLFAEIGGFIVAAERRGEGIGRMLLASAEHWLAENSIKQLRVRTQIQRADAQAFYRRLGFHRAKEQMVFDKLLG